ncbi:hypothetical protein [Aquimarina sediminis]|uniref:hypothetical protein n=1 Tax=Aquimarina sediminis TaxID=2070536 RepID=UPI000CA00ACE|nr:hypothetical protein [Aquimarina sediminis]
MKKFVILISCTMLCCFACKTNSKKEKENEYKEEREVRDPVYIKDNSQKIPTTVEAIAQINGIQHWHKVKEIKFTYNIDQDSSHYERSWKWKPKNDMVTLTSEKDTITYYRTQLDSTTTKIDHKFINDKYWLLAPLHLVWDTKNFTSEHKVKAVAPISNTEMQKLTIVYNNDSGYTPGDAYDFYFKGDFIIKEWVFRKKNQSTPSITTSWEDYQSFNGLKIAKKHKQKEGNRTLYFTEIEVIME